ncbi:elongation of very long chain fatty acids protein-like [Diabrotica virgifera virgifera]|uniref:Elongation of very long chain fatty acids protein n=1 Tax=Diabrotica virgifera virgifera TaxID=50390 RepID=A0ABM5K0W5_DIAVI|nr:elongation of very long chain fatty acids protein-like [Diabrotica virgifera virgifera]XP_050503833.1 elongation of very long chain fatty acids protein-like [Diabrotica virgifera virgifera]XP_050503837.1 elongation of very long chain fatty acids protein-like [Diabrotica virgifera virgifera]
MENVSTSLLDGFHEMFDRNQDHRTKDYFLMSSPIPTMITVAIYLYTIKVLLPAYMKNKKPYDLKNVILIHNFIQVLISTALFLGFLFAGWYPIKYDIKCQSPRLPDLIEGAGIKIMHVSYGYYLSKFVELFDTVFFVLRKKDQHVSFLHVYHHAVMPLWCWGAVKYFPESQMTLYGMINCFIHIVMYTYYMLSAFGPSVQKYLWWKKHITVLQLIQFAIGAVHSLHLLIKGCHVPRLLSISLFLEATFFFYMFGNFYLKAYTKKPATHVTANGHQNNVKKEN